MTPPKEDHRLNVTNFGQACFFLAEAFGKESLRPLMRHAGGFLLEALGEAQELLETAGAEDRERALGRAAEHLFRHDLEPGEFHDSWLLEPIRSFPAAMIGALLAACPPRLARYLAMLLEEEGRASLEKIPPAADLPPVAHRWALSILPPARDASGSSSFPSSLVRDPLTYVARRPFEIQADDPGGQLATMMKDAEEKIGSALPAGLREPRRPSPARSLAAVALALSGRPPEARNLALAMPLAAAAAFLDASKAFSLLVPSEIAAAHHEAFLGYLSGK